MHSKGESRCIRSSVTLEDMDVQGQNGTQNTLAQKQRLGGREWRGLEEEKEKGEEEMGKKSFLYLKHF